MSEEGPRACPEYNQYPKAGLPLTRTSDALLDDVTSKICGEQARSASRFLRSGRNRRCGPFSQAHERLVLEYPYLPSSEMFVALN